MDSKDYGSNEVIDVLIKDIKIGPRFRKDHGNIPELAKLIEDVGLLQPIGLTMDGKLVFGYRRILAFKFLGRDRIPARFLPIKGDQIVEAELDENTAKPWTFSERMAILEHIKERRIGHRVSKGKGDKLSPYQREKKGMKSRDIAAALPGMNKSPVQLQKEFRIHQTIQKHPGQFEKLRIKLDNEDTTIDKAGKRIKDELNDAMRKADNEEFEKEYESLSDKHRYQFEVGDFTDQKFTDKHLKPNSVPLICSDPDWHDEKLPLYIEMGKFACRYLETGSCMVLTLPYDTFTAMKYVLIDGNVDGQLHYQELIPVLMTGGLGFPRNWKSDTVQKAKILLVVVKGHKRKKSPYPKEEYLRNLVIRSRTPDKISNYMSQSPEDFMPFIKVLVPINTRVCDPHLGAGNTAVACKVTKRRFIGFDKREDALKETKANLAKRSKEWEELMKLRETKGELDKIIGGRGKLKRLQ